MAVQIIDGIINSGAADKALLGMANGVDPAAAMPESAADPAMKSVLEAVFPGFPWHARRVEILI